jgi:hypothetical protein
MNSGQFVRDDSTIETIAQLAFNRLNKRLSEKSVTTLAWTEDLCESALGHGLIHNDQVYPEFYTDLVAAIRDEIQTGSFQDVVIGSALAYLDHIELDGFYPLFHMRPGILDAQLMDMEPTFWIFCQDKKLLPESTPFARVSVTQYGNLKFQLFEYDWLKDNAKVKKAYDKLEAPGDKKAKKPAKAKVAAKRKGA